MNTVQTENTEHANDSYVSKPQSVVQTINLQFTATDYCVVTV